MASLTSGPGFLHSEGEGELSYFQEHSRLKVEPLSRGDPGLSLASSFLSLARGSSLPAASFPPKRETSFAYDSPPLPLLLLGNSASIRLPWTAIVVLSLEPGG